MQEIFADTPEALAELAAALAGSEWLALDTEFMREKTYLPRLCLIQVANEDIAACVDPLACADMGPLLDVVYDGSILKVLHAARQDLEIFLNTWHRIPLPLFDTQPAAALLGYGDQVGYAKLVKEVLDVDLAKDHSRTDWCRRPLDTGQTRYALDDVIYLGRVYLQMRGRLSDRERLQWLAADFADLADPATYVQNPRTAWKRVKGRQPLRGVQLAVLQELAAWREEQARARDLPRRWLVKDEVLVELARRRPREQKQLDRVRGMEAGVARRDGSALLAAIERGAAQPKDAWPSERRDNRPLSALEEAKVDLLSAALRVAAEQHQLSPHAVATRKDLEKLVRGNTEVSLLEGWRREVAGSTLLDVLHGNLRLECSADAIRITHPPEPARD
ncbi:MAG: ribonuclease D [Gammaproteobacteria bacterium]